jgi:hypothetical protein
VLGAVNDNKLHSVQETGAIIILLSHQDFAGPRKLIRKTHRHAHAPVESVNAGNPRLDRRDDYAIFNAMFLDQFRMASDSLVCGFAL